MTSPSAFSADDVGVDDAFRSSGDVRAAPVAAAALQAVHPQEVLRSAFVPPRSVARHASSPPAPVLKRLRELHPRAGEFVGNQPARDAECSICLGVMCNPGLLKACGHSFCYQCLLLALRQRPTCPLCGAGPKSCANPASLFVRNFALESQLALVQQRCRFAHQTDEDDDGSFFLDPSGCSAVLPLSEVAGHETSCGFELRRCARVSPNARTPCGAVFRVAAAAAHDAVCPFALVACPLGCPMQGLLRRDAAAHAVSAACTHRLARCRFPGCGRELRLVDVVQHEADSMAEHLRLALEHTATTTRRVADLERSLREEKDLSLRLGREVRTLVNRAGIWQDWWESASYTPSLVPQKPFRMPRKLAVDAAASSAKEQERVESPSPSLVAQRTFVPWRSDRSGAAAGSVVAVLPLQIEDADAAEEQKAVEALVTARRTYPDEIPYYPYDGLEVDEFLPGDFCTRIWHDSNPYDGSDPDACDYCVTLNGY